MPIDYHTSAGEPRDTGLAVKRGLFCTCPQCGQGRIFGKYLKVNPACDSCGLHLDGHRADDMPPYLVIMIVGHIVVGLNLAFEQSAEWPLWVHFAIWPTLTVVSALSLLQPVKGALIGYQWALKMHGFDPENRHVDPALPVPPPSAANR
mgnify:CR=1 FL=1